MVFFGLAGAGAQPLSFGLKGGAILTETRRSALYADRTGTYDYQFALRRDSIGPAFEIGLPARLRFESGFLYRRFRASQNLSLGPSSWDAYDIRGSRWEFPLVLKREFRRSRIRPFFGGGGTWSHTPAPAITVATYREFGPPPYQVHIIRTKGSANHTGGWVATGGLHLRGPPASASPRRSDSRVGPPASGWPCATRRNCCLASASERIGIRPDPAGGRTATLVDEP